MCGFADAQPANPDIHRAMQRFVDDAAVVGVVTLVERAGEIVSLDTAGFTDLATRAPMRPDTLFSIASMSKPIAATAVMMLQDAGQLSIDDPLEKHLPEFRGQKVVTERTPERVVLTPPRHPVTLRMLLTHTSGLNTDLPDEGIGLTQEKKARFYASQPLSFEPGSRWQYSNPGINVLARVVEVVSRESYEAFLQSRLFDPLGLGDTTFWPSEAQARRGERRLAGICRRAQWR